MCRCLDRSDGESRGARPGYLKFRLRYPSEDCWRESVFSRGRLEEVCVWRRAAVLSTAAGGHSLGKIEHLSPLWEFPKLHGREII